MHDGNRVVVLTAVQSSESRRSVESGGDEIEGWSRMEHAFRQAQPDLP